MAARCLPCHSSTPWLAGYTEPPKGLLLETPEQIQAAKAMIHQQVVVAPIMPLGNLTQMTEEERALVGQWTSTP